MTKLKGSKSPFSSKGIIGAILMVIIPILGYFGYDIAKDDVTTLIGFVPAIIGGIVLGWKRFTMEVNKMDVSAWLIAIVSAIGAIYTIFTGDADLVKDLAPKLVAVFTALSSILAAFGIHVAKEKVG